MFSAILVALLAAAPAPEEKPKDPGPVKRELFANEQWYKDQKGQEMEFVGVLSLQAGNGPGIGRFNSYRLMMEETVPYRLTMEETVPVQVPVEREIIKNGQVFKVVEVRTVLETRQIVREVYVGGKPDLLALYVGKKVKFMGKDVVMRVKGQKHNEIWPARIEMPKPSINDELELMDKTS